VRELAPTFGRTVPLLRIKEGGLREAFADLAEFIELRCVRLSGVFMSSASTWRTR